MPRGPATEPVEDIAQAYSPVAAEVGATVAPVAVAWQRVEDAAPDLRLYDGDQLHPNILGMYLTAAVLYATIFRKSPEGLPYLPADSLADSELVNYLRRQWQMKPEEDATCYSASPGRRCRNTRRSKGLLNKWVASHAKTVEFFAPYATDIVFFTIPEGGNNVAIALNVHDMEG